MIRIPITMQKSFPEFMDYWHTSTGKTISDTSGMTLTLNEYNRFHAWWACTEATATKLRDIQNLLDDQIKLAKQLQADLVSANIRLDKKSKAIVKLQEMLAKDAKRRGQ